MDIQTATVNVGLIKQEGITTACNACLSVDRTLSTLSDKADLFTYLLGHQDSILDPESIFICWECKAVLTKMHNFQYQVQYAQMVIQQLFYDKEQSLKSLSKLGFCKLENVDTITDSFGNHNEVDYKYTESKIIFDSDNNVSNIPVIEYISECTDDKETIKKEDGEDYEDSFLDPGHSDQSEMERNIKSEEAPIPKRFRFSKIAKRTRNPDVDLSQYESCFMKSTLTDSEVENLGRVAINKRKAERKAKSYLYCKKCRKEFDIAIDFKRHTTYCHILKEEHSGPFECVECLATCPDKHSLRAHWTEHNTVRRCKLCGVTVFWRYNLKPHAELHAYFWTCTACKDLEAVYRSYRDFGYHFKSIHKRSICDYCGNRSKTKTALSNHIRLKHLPPVCTTCNKEFKNNHCLRRHTHDIHPETIDKKVKPELTYCVECDKQFPSQAKYRLHLKTTLAHNPAVATRKTIVPCPECGKQFSRKSYMNNHYRLFHQKQTKHYCALCDKYLVSAWSMKKHIQGVHQKIREPKTKVCDVCGRAFQTNAVLLKHSRTHTGERPYKCAHCPAAFTQSSALQSHTRTQHK